MNSQGCISTDYSILVYVEASLYDKFKAKLVKDGHKLAGRGSIVRKVNSELFARAVSDYLNKKEIK